MQSCNIINQTVQCASNTGWSRNVFLQLCWGHQYPHIRRHSNRPPWEHDFGELVCNATYKHLLLTTKNNFCRFLLPIVRGFWIIKQGLALKAQHLYRVFDNDRYKVWAYFWDQKASLGLKTGGKISLSLVHFDKYMSN